MNGHVYLRLGSHGAKWRLLVFFLCNPFNLLLGHVRPLSSSMVLWLVQSSSRVTPTVRLKASNHLVKGYPLLRCPSLVGIKWVPFCHHHCPLKWIHFDHMPGPAPFSDPHLPLSICYGSTPDVCILMAIPQRETFSQSSPTDFELVYLSVSQKPRLITVRKNRQYTRVTW